MKWVNHRLVSGVLVYAATEDPLLAVCAAVGAVIPDKVEGYPLKNYKRWKKRHRGWSHAPLLYLALIAAVYFISEKGFIPVDVTLPANMGMAFLTGAVLHIAEDALCGKVPLIYPGRKYGMTLFKVDSAGEYLFSAAVVLAVLLLKFDAVAQIFSAAAKKIGDIPLL